jgi:hypothetical protein
VSPLAPPCFKCEGGAETPDARATNPVGVFDSLFPCVCAVRGEEEGRRRHTAPGERRADHELGAGAGEGRRRGHLPRQRDPLHRAGHAYTADPT